MKSHIRLVLFRLVLIFLLYPSLVRATQVSSAQTRDRKTEEGSGEIIVGTPKIFGRERLMRERSREVQWLDDQLEKGPSGLELSARRDERISSIFSSIIEGQLKTDLELELQLSGVEEEKRRRELAEKEHEIALARLEKELEKLKADAGDGSGDGGSGAEDTAVLEAKIDQLRTTIETLKSDIKNPATNPNTSEGSGGIFNSSGPSHAEVGLNGTSIERLSDQIAYREFVLSQQRDKLLDDYHDLNGKVLYDFRIPITLIPPNGESRLGKVTVTLKADDEFWQLIEKGENASPSEVYKRDILLEDFFRDWSHSFIKQAGDEIRYHVERILEKGRMPKDDLFQADLGDYSLAYSSFAKELEKRYVGKGESSEATDLQSMVKILSAPQFYKIDRIKPVIQSEDVKELTNIAENAYRGIISIIPSNDAEYYAASAPTLVAVEYLKNRYGKLDFIDIGSRLERDRYIPDIKLRNTDLTNKIKNFIDIKGANYNLSKVVAIQSVEPREQAQNISEFGAQRTSSDLALIFSGLVGGNGLDADATIKSREESQLLVDSITRRPLAVSFSELSESEASFGWVLGPRFELKRKRGGFLWLGKRLKPVFEHTPISHYFNVSVAVPAYARSLRFKVERSWIQSDGSSRSFSTGPTTFEVRLVPEFAPLTAHMAADYGPRSAPMVTRRLEDTVEDSDPPYLVSTKDPEKGPELLIRGANLWRNPEVFIGNVRASSVEPLPDMMGLLAYFPDRLSNAESTRLTVVTSQGKDTIENGVRVALPTKLSTSKDLVPFARLEKAWFVAPSGWSAALTAKVDLTTVAGLRPSNLLQVKTVAYPTGQFGAAETSVTSTDNGSKISLEIPIINQLSVAPGGLLTLESYVRSMDGKRNSILTAPIQVAVFTNADESKLRLNSVGGNPKAGSTWKLDLKPLSADQVNLFRLRYPGLIDQSGGLKVLKLNLRKDGSTLVFVRDGDSFNNSNVTKVGEGNYIVEAIYEHAGQEQIVEFRDVLTVDK